MSVTGITRLSWWVYVLLVKAGFRRQSRYRLAMLAGLFTNIVFGCIRAAVLGAAAFAAGGQLAGYSTAALMGFVWLGQALLGSINLWGRSDLTERVRTGDIAVDFSRPVSVVGAQLATDVGASAYVLIPRAVPSLAIGALTFGLGLATTWTNWLTGLCSVAVGIVLSHLTVYPVALVGLWTVETRGFIAAYAVIASFLAGLVVPVSMMPPWLGQIATATPWPSMLQTPIDILTGRLTGSQMITAFGIQLAWLIAIVGLTGLVFRLGRRHLEVQGG